MKINFVKTDERAKLPERNNKGVGGLYVGDTGYDIYAVGDVVIPGMYGNKAGTNIVPVGLEVAYIEPGFWFRIEGRSGMGFKHGIMPHFGIIDNGYRGDLAIKLYNLTAEDYGVTAGDRIAQLVVYPLIEAEMGFTEKTASIRGDSGFGSSGK